MRGQFRLGALLLLSTVAFTGAIRCFSCFYPASFREKWIDEDTRPLIFGDVCLDNPVDNRVPTIDCYDGACFNASGTIQGKHVYMRDCWNHTMLYRGQPPLKTDTCKRVQNVKYATDLNMCLCRTDKCNGCQGENCSEARNTPNGGVAVFNGFQYPITIWCLFALLVVLFQPF